MKVGIFVVSLIRPGSGGQFTYFEKLVDAIDRHSFDPRLEICFVGRSSQKTAGQKEYRRISPLFFYLGFWLLEKFRLVTFFSRICFTNVDLCNRLDKYLLRKYNVDVLLYPKQTYMEVRNFPFVTMNWDTGHKSTYAFPELILKGSFETREKWYQKEMQKSLAIFAESEAGKKELEHYFSIHPDKVSVVPLFPGNVAELVVAAEEENEVLDNLGLKKLRYFYYPAQFWAHKNHYNLVLAFYKLLSKPGCEDLKLMLTGTDKGNKKYILSVIKKHNLAGRVLVSDYVSTEAVHVLYKNSLALVMPTFLGPTNMPLLEAQSMGTAIICSDFEGHRELCGDGAIYIQPGDVDGWCDAMLRVMDDAFRASLIERAQVVKKSSPFNVDNAVTMMERHLIRLIPIRMAFR